MVKVIIPKTYVGIEDPLIFLAGPIMGAPNWQDKAIEIFSSQENLVVASPRRDIREKIAPYIINGDENHFSRQRAWERHYLDIASKKGVILFWLPGEEAHSCGKVYGAMTRLELGQWMTNYRHNNDTRFVIGSDGKFPEMRIITYDLSFDAPTKIINTTLEQTCEEALRIAREKVTSTKI